MKLVISNDQQERIGKTENYAHVGNKKKSIENHNVKQQKQSLKSEDGYDEDPFIARDSSPSSSDQPIVNKENHAGHKKKSLNVGDEDGTEQEEAEAASREKLSQSIKKQVKNLEDEYNRLSLQFESAMIQHKLAMEYYDFRSYYFVFLPVTLIATLITIIGFLISGTTQDNDNDGTAEAQGSEDESEPLLTGQSKQIWSLVVGILGAISTLFNAISKRTNYQSQSDMHRSAVKALEKICLTVEFEREWFDRKRLDLNLELKNADSEDDIKTLIESLGADLKTHQASFKAMLDACCDSPVPCEVSQTFTLLEQIFYLQSNENGGDLKPLMYQYHKLWKEYSKYWLWPLKAPSITVPEKYKEWREERANFSVDDDEESVGLRQRIWTFFCCGK